MRKETIHVYTDASMKAVSNPSKFQIGYVILNEEGDDDYRFALKGDKDFLRKYFKWEQDVFIRSCNMETFAILHALRYFTKKGLSQNLTFYTDSTTTFEKVNGITSLKKLTGLNTQGNKIMYQNKKKVDRQTYRQFWLKIILELKEAIRDYQGKVEINWIKGHCGVYGNEAADKAANEVRKREVNTIGNFFIKESSNDKMNRELTKLIYSL